MVEKQPGAYGLEQGDVGIKNAFPTIRDVSGSALEPGLPFLRAKLCRADVGEHGRARKHMDALNVLGQVSEVCGMVDFVLKELYRR